MRVTTPIRAAGDTHPGLHRQINEDRYHLDPARGVFIVVDGIGGQAAGEKAAETALAMVKARLERETGTLEDRVREAIAVANREVYRQASLQPEWHGMACVLTVAVLDGDGGMVVGHVGDTRLYKVRDGEMVKLTRDHSPVGEREDAGELTEQQAMRHPRRNEVYRDVGSQPHEARDTEFVDVFHTPFEPDAALVLCSDGLTDYVTSERIRRTVQEYAGNPDGVVRALIGAANDAGGKDNVTVVYAEGSRFAADEDTRDLRRGLLAGDAVTPRPALLPNAAAEPRGLSSPGPEDSAARRRWRTNALLVSLILTLGLAAYAVWMHFPLAPSSPAIAPPQIVVTPGSSIATAIATATTGWDVVVEPGEYRERIVMKSGVRVRSRVPRAALLRLPGGASEADAAVIALDVQEAEFAGFRIAGDAATPLGTGILLRNTDLTIVDIDISGAQQAAIEFATGTRGSVIGAEIHDNPGAGLILRSGAAPRVAHSLFTRNALAGRAAGAVFIEPGAAPQFAHNVFHGIAADALKPSGMAREVLLRDNWFFPSPPQQTRDKPRSGRGRKPQ